MIKKTLKFQVSAHLLQYTDSVFVERMIELFKRTNIVVNIRHHNLKSEIHFLKQIDISISIFHL